MDKDATRLGVIMIEENTNEFEVEISKETEKAFLLKNVDTLKESWFPKTTVSFNPRRPNDTGAAVISSWILEKNKWID